MSYKTCTWIRLSYMIKEKTLAINSTSLWMRSFKESLIKKFVFVRSFKNCQSWSLNNLLKHILFSHIGIDVLLVFKTIINSMIQQLQMSHFRVPGILKKKLIFIKLGYCLKFLRNSLLIFVVFIIFTLKRLWIAII